MDLQEFNSLPKLKKSFGDRLKDEIKKLKKVIHVDSNTDLNFDCSGRCCGKRTFETEKDALDAITHRKIGKNSYKPKRAYECENGKWHLTSMNMNEYIDYAKRNRL